MHVLHIVHSIAQICMDGIILIGPTSSSERSSVPNPRPVQAGTHPYIILHASLREN